MHELDLDKCCAEMSAMLNNDEYAPLAIFLGCTEALQMIHHTHHWQTSGENYYGDHLLYQRLYTDILLEIDLVGEKLIGVSQNPALTNYFARMKMIQKFLEMVTSKDDYIIVSTKAEKTYLKVGEHMMDNLEKAGLLSRGLEQMLGNILDKHEEHLYLLNQRVQKV